MRYNEFKDIVDKIEQDSTLTSIQIKRRLSSLRYIIFCKNEIEKQKCSELKSTKCQDITYYLDKCYH